MNPKFRNLYLIGGTVALILLIVQIISTYPYISPKAVLLSAIPALLLYFLAYKTYHEHKDGEMM